MCGVGAVLERCVLKRGVTRGNLFTSGAAHVRDAGSRTLLDGFSVLQCTQGVVRAALEAARS